ncbi:Endonuclease I [Vibrio vulnificus]|nr:endonuclease [Vibrio vulnificus]ARN68543.1 Endonuclease I [Vibrio vulnificus]
MQAWDKQYPTTKVECQRAQRIKQQQGNANPILAERCN